MGYNKSQFAKLTEGRGKIKQDEGFDPYCKPHELNGTKGLSVRMKNWKGSNLMICLSKLELLFNCSKIWDDNVTNIYTQYALPLADTVRIAKQLGVRHPTINENGIRVPVVRTIDALIESKIDGNIVRQAYTVKPKKKLKSTNVRKKFLIEKKYFNENGFEYFIITEDSFDYVLACNVYSIYSKYWWAENKGLEENIVLKMTQAFYSYLNQYDYDAIKSARSLENCYGLKCGEGIDFLKYLITHKKVIADMSKPLILGRQKIKPAG